MQNKSAGYSMSIRLLLCLRRGLRCSNPTFFDVKCLSSDGFFSCLAGFFERYPYPWFQSCQLFLLDYLLFGAAWGTTAWPIFTVTWQTSYSHTLLPFVQGNFAFFILLLLKNFARKKPTKVGRLLMFYFAILQNSFPFIVLVELKHTCIVSRTLLWWWVVWPLVGFPKL